MRKGDLDCYLCTFKEPVTQVHHTYHNCPHTFNDHRTLIQRLGRYDLLIADKKGPQNQKWDY